MKLRHNILLAMLALLIAAQGLSLYFVLNASRSNAIERTSSQVSIAEGVVRADLMRRQADLQRVADIAAQDFGLKRAVATGDMATIRSVLGNHGRRVRAHLVAAAGNDGQLLAAVSDRPGVREELSTTGNDDLRQLMRGARILTAVISGEIYELVATDINAPERVGRVFFGFRLDQDYLDQLASLTDTDVSVWLQGSPVISSQPNPLDSLDMTTLPVVPAAGDAPVALVVGESELLVKRFTIDADGGSSFDIVLARSMDETLATYHALRNKLLWIMFASVVIGGIVALGLASRVTTPVRRLAESAREIAAGRYQDIALDGNDEVRTLAGSLNRMQTAISERESRIAFQSRHDSLTGLVNRGALVERVQNLLDLDRRFLVLVLDVNRFKEINDSLGHHTGDELLRMLGQRLGRMVGSDDLLGRLGADEFMLVLADIDSSAAEDVADRLHTLIEPRFEVNTTPISVGVALGIAASPEHGDDAEMLLRRADNAMYTAKANRQGWCIYRSGEDEQHLARLALINDMGEAIAKDQFVLLYQPKVDLANDQLIQAEALIRWNHPTRGMLGPDLFIPLAEQSGLISGITRWVLNKAFAQLAAWTRDGVDLGIAVNLSAVDLIDQRFVSLVTQCINAHCVPPEKITLEVTESVVMQDIETAVDCLKRLREMGFHISIDDFGTGHSSLAQLKSLPVTELKIDKSFVMQMADSLDDQTIVRATIDLGHNLGLKVVAEGIETEGGENLLKEFGCDRGQGYHYSRPIDALAIRDLFSSKNLRADPPTTRSSGSNTVK